MTESGVGIIYLFPYVPKIGKLMPSPLACINFYTVSDFHAAQVSDNAKTKFRRSKPRRLAIGQSFRTRPVAERGLRVILECT